MILAITFFYVLTPVKNIPFILSQILDIIIFNY